VNITSATRGTDFRKNMMNKKIQNIFAKATNTSTYVGYGNNYFLKIKDFVMASKVLLTTG
jgi:hypothetical protein